MEDHQTRGSIVVKFSVRRSQGALGVYFSILAVACLLGVIFSRSSSARTWSGIGLGVALVVLWRVSQGSTVIARNDVLVFRTLLLSRSYRWESIKRIRLEKGPINLNFRSVRQYPMLEFRDGSARSIKEFNSSSSVGVDGGRIGEIVQALEGLRKAQEDKTR